MPEQPVHSTAVPCPVPTHLAHSVTCCMCCHQGLVGRVKGLAQDTQLSHLGGSEGGQQALQRTALRHELHHVHVIWHARAQGAARCHVPQKRTHVCTARREQQGVRAGGGLV